MITVNAMGDPCPIPVVKTKKAIQALTGAGIIEVLVDNEIAVQNLTKMAVQKGYGVRSEKLEEQKYRVIFEVGEPGPSGGQADAKDSGAPGQEGGQTESEVPGAPGQEGGQTESEVPGAPGQSGGQADAKDSGASAEAAPQEIASSDYPQCHPDRRRNVVVVISSDRMGEGNDELGGVLMKSFLYALAQQDELPSTVLFYNGGVKYTCEESPSLEDLRSLEAQGVEILSCGTCLNYYGLTDRLQVGGVSNMYAIAEKMTQAELVVKP